jgi:hypothetical protein
MKQQLEVEVSKGRGSLKKKIHDPLLAIKDAIYKKWEINNAMPRSTQLGFTQDVMKTTALEMKQVLLERHKESGNKILAPKELEAIQNFYASSGWCTKVAQQFGWVSLKFYGEAGSVDVKKVEPRMKELCLIVMQYDPSDVYN